MPLQTTQTLASVLARGVGLGIRKEEAIEEQEERRKELARYEAAIKRQRKAARQTGLGRLFGGGIGAAISALVAPATGGLSLLIPALLGGLGSGAGQLLATRGVARERLAPIGVGAFQVGRGREREAEFRLGERGFREELGGGILSSALRDALSAMAFQNLLQGRGGSFGGSPGVTFPGAAPEALSRRLTGLGPAPSSIEQSLSRALGGTF